jgi:hypothetical protein
MTAPRVRPAIRTALVLVAALAAAPGPAYAQDTAAPARPPLEMRPRRGISGTSITLQVPAGFVPFDDGRYTGFHGTATGARLVGTEMPVPVREIWERMPREMAQAESRLAELDTVTVAGREALLARVTTEGAPAVEAWTMVFGHDFMAVTVMAMYRADDAPVLRDAIRRSLLSVQWDSARAGDMFADMGFRLDGTDELRATGRLGVTAGFAEGGLGPPAAQGYARLVVTSVPRIGRDMALETLARDFLNREDQLKEVVVRSSTRVDVDGVPGWEVVAEAVEVNSGARMLVYRVLLRDRTQYRIIHAEVGADRADHFLPQFRQIVHSYRRTPRS